MRHRTATIGLLVALFALLAGQAVWADDAPAELASALTIKLSGFEKNISSSGDVTIYVLGDEALAAELKKAVGQKIGGATLSDVTSGTDLPASKPTILCLGDASKVAAVTEYTRSNGVLSVTGKPELAEQGVTLGLGVGGDGKPAVSLNMTASKAEGCNWNPAILKIAEKID
jgi:hypothetical protein